MGVFRLVTVLLSTFLFIADRGSGVVDAHCCSSLDPLPTNLIHVGQALFGTPNESGQVKDTEYGASVHLSSSNGDVLAVGAPHHGYRLPNTDPNQMNIDGGGVFLYNFDGVEWRLRSFFAGNQGEQIGNHISLSDDGSRIAIRRYNSVCTGIFFVEVHDIAFDGMTTKAGSDISCGSDIHSVSLSSTGTRIAISCYSVNDGHNVVQIFEWRIDLVDWVPIGRIQDGCMHNTESLFGWSVAFGGIGSRLAVSAPNFSYGGVFRRGLVRIYDYAGESAWIQVGADIVGLTTEEQFGFAMQMSRDGFSVVIGAPQSSNGSANPSYGAVSVFALDSISNVWAAVGQVIFGERIFGRFGRSVSISGNGQRIAVGSNLVKGGKGIMIVLDFNGIQWERTFELVDAMSHDRFGFGLLSVSLSCDGHRVATGAMRANNTIGIPTGQVRVFSDGESPLSVSSSPTKHPSIDRIASCPPSGNRPSDVFVTSDPTTNMQPYAPASPAIFTTNLASPTSAMVSTSSPSVTPPKLEWDLGILGDAVVSSINGTTKDKITLNYNISSNRRVVINVFDQNCTTHVPNNLVQVSTVTKIETYAHSNLQVCLDVNLETVVNTAIWGDTGNGVGFINVCVRVDLVLDDDNTTSVNHHEQKLKVALGIEQPFSFVTIHLNRDPTLITQFVHDEYDILVCQCNAEFACVHQVISVGSDVYICVHSHTPGVQVIGISELIFRQGTYSVSPITNSTEDILTTVSYSDEGALIRSQLRSQFFSSPEPDNFLVEGIAVLSIDNYGPNRLPRHVSRLRKLHETKRQSKVFSVTMKNEFP